MGKKDVNFSPGDAIYQLKSDSSSPFHKRNLPIFPRDRKTKAKLLLIRKIYYELFYANEKESYLARFQEDAKIPSAAKKTVFPDQTDLRGNPKQIFYSMIKLSERIVAIFKKNPQNLFAEANRIEIVCREINYEIPRIQAFDRINNWDEFMQLLDSIVSHRSIDQFELLLAAIFQYAKRCGYE